MKLSLRTKRLLAITLLTAVTAAGILWFHDSKNPPGGHAQTPDKAPVLDRAYAIPPPVAPTQVADPIRADIRAALAATTPAIRRMELILALPSDLSEVEYTALLHEVITPPTPGTAEAWHSSFVHEICKLLHRIPAGYDAYANALATVASSREFSEVYRDYAFQHLRILWQNSLDPQTPGVLQPRNIVIEQTFRALISERPETAAQSILSLHGLRYDDNTPAVPDREISTLVNQILTSSDQSQPAQIPSRMTAIRIIAERNLPDSSDALKAIASSPQEHILVRTSAIGAIGHAAAPENEAFLKSLPADNPLIAEALAHALKQY